MNREQRSLPTDAGIDSLARTLTDTNSWVRDGCNEIAALAQLALASLHAPEDFHRPQALAHALCTIRDAAESLADYVQGEASAAGCDATA